MTHTGWRSLQKAGQLGQCSSYSLFTVTDCVQSYNLRNPLKTKKTFRNDWKHETTNHVATLNNDELEKKYI